MLPTERARFALVHADDGVASDFAADVRAGLSTRRKRLPCRYLYDAAGSRLFEAICELPEYYLTRAERSILHAQAPAIAAATAPGSWLVELGSGSAAKTRTLIAALLRRQRRLRYLPIDISPSILQESAAALVREHPQLEVTAVAAEYGAGLALLCRERAQAKLILWLGSNVGNFTRRAAARFLGRVRRAMGPPDRLLLGIDLRKRAALLERAYDDARGVTAQFNLNLLRRINRQLGGRFDLATFTHRARYRAPLGRVDMHLTSRCEQTVRIDAIALSARFAAGESIHTESSYKYRRAEIEQLARAAGFAVEQRWLDDGRRYCLALLAPLSG